MQKYIKPVRAMLGQYKQSISHIRDNQGLLTKSTDVSVGNSDQNACPNVGGQRGRIESMTRRREKNYKEISLKELDQEIVELAKKLNLH